MPPFTCLPSWQAGQGALPGTATHPSLVGACQQQQQQLLQQMEAALLMPALPTLQPAEGSHASTTTAAAAACPGGLGRADTADGPSLALDTALPQPQLYDLPAGDLMAAGAWDDLLTNSGGESHGLAGQQAGRGCSDCFSL